MKKFKYYLQLVDGIWSIPLAILTFWIIGVLLTAIFGFSVGTYDIGFIQPLFLAAAVVIGATNVAVWGMYFTFRGLYHYIYGKQLVNTEGKSYRVNYSKVNWLDLSPWQRYLIAFGVFFYFSTAIIIVYLQFV